MFFLKMFSRNIGTMKRIFTLVLILMGVFFAEAQQPHANINPSYIDFPETQVGAAYETEVYVQLDSGFTGGNFYAQVEYGYVGMVGDGPFSFKYAWEEEFHPSNYYWYVCCAEDGAYFPIRIRFAPTEEGDFSAMLHLYTENSDIGFVPLSGSASQNPSAGVIPMFMDGISNIGMTAATANFTVNTAALDYNPYYYGIVWGISTNPDLSMSSANTQYFYDQNASVSTAVMESLTSGTTYYVRGVANYYSYTYGDLTYYSSEMNFTTTALNCVDEVELTPCNVGMAHTNSADYTDGTGGLETLKTGSSNEISHVADQDGNTYAVVQIGSQCWMAENLRTTRYADGSPASASGLTMTRSNAYTSTVNYYYDYAGGDAANVPSYGMLYNWYATVGGSVTDIVTDQSVQGVCPKGWHVPCWNELETMAINAGATFPPSGNGAGKLAKGCEWTEWGSGDIASPANYDYSERNSSGFGALPAGYFYLGNYYNFGTHANFMSSTLTQIYNENDAMFCLYMGYQNVNLAKSHMYLSEGLSVRCLRNEGAIATLPTVTTGAVSDITTTKAICGGNVTDDGGVLVTARGVCWSTTPNPTVADAHTGDGTGINAFTSIMTRLTPATTYYVRAYATNSEGTAYGEEVTFTTTAASTTFTCGDNLVVGDNSYITQQYGSQCWMTENLRNAGGSEHYSWTTAIQACPSGWHLPSREEWATLANYVDNNSSIDNYIPLFFEYGSGEYWMDYTMPWQDAEGTAYTLAIPCNISGQTINTNYGIAYVASQNEVEASTRCVRNENATASLPTVTTGAASGIMATTAICGGNVTADGDATVTERGVCWSASQNPTVADNHTSDGTGTGAFTSAITGLTPNTTYYVRAYATNSEGTAYGEEVSFTTADGTSPTDDNIIGSGDATNTYLPSYSYYKYSLTQQIYTAEEIGTAGIISSIAFYNAGAEKTRTYNMYLIHTDKETFGSNTDWVAMSSDDLVFSGELTFTVGEWTTITLDDPFVYDGTSNLLVGVADVTGSYTGSPHMACLVFDATSQAIRAYRDNGGPYDIAAPGVNGTIQNVKNQIKLEITPSESPVCKRPTSLAAIDVAPHTATLTWNENGSAIAWQLCLNDDTTNLIDVTTNPYTLSNLPAETACTVKVRANCGSDGYSSWSFPVTFTTLVACPVPENLAVNDITVSQATATWTGSSDSYNVRLGWDDSTTTLSYFDFESDEIPTQFVNDPTYAWTVVADDIANSHYIRSGNAGVHSSSSAISITVNCPADDTIEFDAECRGEGGSTYWDHCDFSIDDTRVLYAGANISGWNHYSFPVTSGTHTFTWSYTKDGSVHPNGDYFAVDNIFLSSTEIIWGDPVSVVDAEYTFSVLDPETRYYVTVQGVCGEDLSLETHILSFTTQPLCPAPTELSTIDVSTHSATLGWNGWNESSTTTVWQLSLNDDTTNLVTADNNSFTLPGLTPGTTYTVKVRANCGSDGYSKWSTPVTFTTASCPDPTVLDTAVCASELPLTWHGHIFEEFGNFTDTLTTADGCDSVVTLRVRNLSYYSSLLNDDFNDGVIDPEKWTYTGNTVIEEDGQLELYQNVTDQDVHLLSVDLNVPANGKVTMDRRFRVHRSDNSYYGDYFYGNSRFYLNGGDDYVGLQYNYTTYEGWYGTYLIYSIDGDEGRVRLCDATFDTWVTEQMEIDFFDGTLSYYLDTLVATVDIPGLSTQTVDYFNAFFNPGGWWTGHQHFLDYVDIYGGIGTVRTSPASEVAYTSATCGGEVTPNECDAYTSAGVCWSTSHNPTLDDAHTSDGTGAGTFTSELTGLTEGTSYYVRAYATNSTDTVYGQEVSFTTCRTFSFEFEDVICEGALPYIWNDVPYNASGDYVQTFTTAANCDSVVTLHLTVHPDIAVTITGETNVSIGQSTTLTASGADIYTWIANDEIIGNNDSVTVSPEVSTTYSVTGYMQRRNLVVNGDFEQGNTGFTTAYSYVNDGSYGHYYIGHDNHEMWSWDPAANIINDHTTGGGLWMMVDAYTNRNIWSQTLEVTPNTDYVFSAWFVTDNIANVRFEINDQQGEIFTTPQQWGVWERRQLVWNSGSSTSANLKIVTGSATSGGHDFGIDDISFSELICESAASVMVVVCPDPVTLDTTVCPSELPLTWHGHTFEEFGIFTDTLTTADGCDSIVMLRVRNLSYYNNLLSDDFNDGVIDPNKWTYTGNAVIEEDGLLKMQQNVTDQDVHLRSVSMDVPDDGKVDIDRRFMVHRNSQYYYGSNYLYFNGDNNSYIQLQYTYAEYYDNAYHHSDPMNGIYVYSRVGGVESNVRICDIEFDTWLTEHVELDFITGTMSYYMDTLVATVNIPGLSSQTVDSFCVQYHPYGWWTGHQHYMDYVEIHAGTGTVRTSPASNVAYTTATCGGDVAPNECVTYTATGVCWSTSQNPTLSDAHTTDGTGVGVFTSELTGLEEGTTYYVRAYALGGTDTVYGQMVSFTTCRHFSTEFADAICEGELPYIWNDVPYNASGDYVQTFTTAANCDSMVTLHLTVLPPPTVEIVRAAGYSATVCEGSSTAIEAVVTGGYGEVTYVWLENGNPLEFNAVLNIGNLTPGADNLYTVEVAQEGSSCYNSASVALNTLVTVYPQFTVSVSAPVSVCDNATLTLTATAENASSADELTYQWNGVPSETSGANAATYTSANLQAGSYDCFVAVTGNVSGCYAESEPVHVEILPTYHTTQYDTICHGFDYDFFGQSLTETGSYIHTLQAANGCDSVITLELTVYPVYTVAVTASGTTLCEGNTLTLNANVEGVIPNNVPAYQWYQTLDGNQVAVSGANSTTYSTSDLLVNNTYEYFLTLTSNVKGCSVVSNTVTATVVALPTVTIAGLDNVDLGQNVTLTASGAESYQWSANSANISADASVTVSPEVPTTYSVTGTDQYGCTGSASVTVTVNYPPTVTTETVSDITSFSATCGGNVTADGGANVTSRGVCWSTDHNPAITDTHIAAGEGTGSFTSEMTGLEPLTTYYVRAYATNSVGTAYGEEVSFTTAENCIARLTVISNDPTYGTCTGSGCYSIGDIVTINAVPNQGKVFLRWSDSVTTNPREVVVASDTTFTAIFEYYLPELHVTAISHSDFVGGETATISWTVQNDGTSPTPNGAVWYDRVWLSLESRVAADDNNPILLGQFPNVSALNPGEYYTQTQTFDIPLNLAGSYFLFVITDAFDAHHIYWDSVVQIPYNPPAYIGALSAHCSRGDCGNGAGNKILEISEASMPSDYYPSYHDNFFYEMVDVAIPPLPNLKVSAIYPTAQNFFSGTDVDFAYQVKNFGAYDTRVSDWKDMVFVSNSPVFDENAQLIKSISHHGLLLPDSSYQVSTTVSIPIMMQGTAWFYVYTDYYDQVYEHIWREDNVSRSDEVNIILTPPADLVPQNITADNTVSTGATFNFSYEVHNIGAGDPNNGTWLDRCYLSTSADSLENVIHLADNMHYNGLASEDFYSVSRTMALPSDMTEGTYYLFIHTDVENNVFEYNLDANNLACSGQPISVVRPDLQIHVLQTEDTLHAAAEEGISYYIANMSEGAVINQTIIDRVYLSPNADGADAVQIAELSHNLWLNPLDSLQKMQNVAIPGDLQDGNYYIFVSTNATQSLNELDLTNNTSPYRQVYVLHLSLPDLVISSVGMPDTVTAGDTAVLGIQLHNQGEVSASIGNLSWQLNVTVGGQTFACAIGNWNADTQTLPVGATASVQMEALIPPMSTLDSVSFELTVNPTHGVMESVYSNNSYDIARVVRPYPFDLAVTELSSPAETLSGDSAMVSWTVENIGIAPSDTWPLYVKSNTSYQQVQGDQLPFPWYDVVYLSHDSLFDNTDEEIGRYGYTNVLNSGGTYSANVKCMIPLAAGGDYYVLIVNDATNVTFDCQRANNVRVQPLAVTPSALPDLRIDTLMSPDSIITLESYQIHYIVSNRGEHITHNDSWTDAVYLNSQPTLEGAQQLGTKVRDGQLEINDYYIDSIQVTIPHISGGDYYLIGYTDATNQTVEMNNDNNLFILPVTVIPCDLPDLWIDTLEVSTVVTTGESYQIQYTVSNGGEYVTRTDRWTDAFYLNSAPTLQGAQHIGSKIHNGVLDVNSNYTDAVQVTIPNIAAGDYYLIGYADATNQVLEVDSDVTNLFMLPVTVARPLPCDLTVLPPDFPTSANIGEDVEVSWTLQNVGFNPAQGNIKEAVYLSTDSVWSSDDIMLGSMTYTVNLASGGQAQRSATLTLQGVPTGDYYVVVRTNILNALNENTYTNNKAVSLMTMHVDYPSLYIGQEEQRELGSGQSAYYKLEVGPEYENQTLSCKLTTAAPNISNGLYIAYSSAPTASNFNFSATLPYVQEQEILIPSLEQGTYYIMVTGQTSDNSTQNVTILASIINFEILSVDANSGANTGSVTTQIIGAKFDTIMDFRLANSNGYLPAEKVFFHNSTESFVTFNLRDQETGVYDVVAELPGGIITIKDQAFVIEEGLPAELLSNIIAPASVRNGNTFTVTIEYGNIGSTDLDVAGILLVSPNGYPIAFTSEGLSNNAYGLIFETAEPNGNPDVIRPGYIANKTIFVKAVRTGNIDLKVYPIRRQY